MANKSNPATQTISIPQGGGALHGIGETFSPDLHTGTGNFTVPIALPPGRNGFQPQLSLVYSTGNGNGPYGLGWSLTIPGVSRKTSKGIPRYRNDPSSRQEGDTFILSGAEDLIPVSETGGITRYRPRTEGLFARIEHHATPETDHWEVRSKDGLVSVYGTPFTSPDDPAAIANPENRAEVFSWNLTKTVDPFGNTIQYEYERDAGDTSDHHWDQLYLKRIQYADYTELGADGNPVEKFLVSVTLVYEERPDPFSDHRAGFEIRTRRRCTSIEIRTHADRERLVRTYRLIYLDQRGLPIEQLPLNAVSLLSQVLVEGPRRRAPRVAAAAGIRLHGVRADQAALPTVHRSQADRGRNARSATRNTSWSICSATVCPPSWSSTTRCATGATAAMAGSTSCAPWRRLRRACA